MNWQTIWSIYFTADKWQYLRLCGNWSDINQQTVKYESFTMVLNCVFVLAPARKWSSPLQAVWETQPGRDSIRAAMQIVLWAFKGNGSQSGDCVQICWLLFWRGQAFFFFFLSCIYTEEVRLSFLLVIHNVMITMFQNTLRARCAAFLGQILTTGEQIEQNTIIATLRSPTPTT